MIGPAGSLKYKVDDSPGVYKWSFKHSYHEVSLGIMESESSSLSQQKPHHYTLPSHLNLIQSLFHENCPQPILSLTENNS
jgi:hypothetical protein